MKEHLSPTQHLLNAMRNNRPKAARRAIENGADITIEEGSPLRMACDGGHFELVRLLLEKGADPRASNNNAVSPLDLASWHGHMAIVRLLLEYRADVNARDDNGDTPLHAACERGHADIARLLIDAGAEVGATAGDGSTPLHTACRYGHVELSRLLVSQGADVTVVDHGGHTPLDLAVILLPMADPNREGIIQWFKNNYPEMVMETFCTTTLGPGGM